MALLLECEQPYRSRKKGLIFGASSGVGAALVQFLSNEVSNLYAVSRRGKVLNDYQEEKALPDNVKSLACDVRQYQQVKQLISQVPKDIDFMVSCVGVGFYAPLDADYSEAWKNIFETNVVGNINVLSNVTSLLPQCKKIIVLGSVASKRPSDTPGNSVYRASKVALATFLSDYRRELRAKGNETKICNIEPGFIEGTDFGRRFFETNPEKQANLYQSFKSLTAADVAGVICDVLRQDDNLDIGEIVVRPVGQPT